MQRLKQIWDSWAGDTAAVLLLAGSGVFFVYVMVALWGGVQ